MDFSRCVQNVYRKGKKMRAREPFTLFKRQMASGKVVYYYCVYIEDGKRLRISTGCRTKAAAVAYVLGLIKDGNLVPKDCRSTSRMDTTFSEFATDWWTWGHCGYIASQLALGFHISQSYAETNRRLLEKYIVPAFGKQPLGQITPGSIERWMRVMVTPGRTDKEGKPVRVLASKTVKNIVSILSVMLEDARRQGLIAANPCKEVRMMAVRSKSRGVLTVSEVRLLFDEHTKWDNPIARTANLLAAMTGMRSGEICALRCMDVKSDHIHVEHSYDERFGLKCTKTGDVRDLPLPEKVLELLHVMLSNRKPNEFLFASPLNSVRPISRASLLSALQRALKEIGISKQQIRDRNIGFHSWRHFLNSQLLSHGISGEKTRLITGHTTEDMTRRYSHFSVEDYGDILEVTAKIVGD
jgi:integrase